MINLNNSLRRITPVQLLVFGYAIITLVAAVLLSLSIASSKGTSQPFIDALFVAASGISTTGLTIVDIGSYYSLFGQIVLMIDFQIGGVGYMTFFVFLIYVLGTHLSLFDKITAKDSLSGVNLDNLYIFFKAVIIFTLIFELGGTIILALYWAHEFSILRSIYLGFYHSVAAFCTAGFSLFPTSLMPYQKSIITNVTVDIVSLAGGIGFFVLYDIYTVFKKIIKNEYPRGLSLHSKLTLVVNPIVVVIGMLVILLSENWDSFSNIGSKLLVSSFQSISASTTDGFNTVDIGVMSSGSLFVLILLMLIGASPGSTGGGFKTTTLDDLPPKKWTLRRVSGIIAADLKKWEVSNGRSRSEEEAV
ncbi:MAG: hypothetical protein HY919_08725 [Elusimicrobia bacterium]|nr:hypothetical protein [Elusimicrobiota bacterium]